MMMLVYLFDFCYSSHGQGILRRILAHALVLCIDDVVAPNFHHHYTQLTHYSLDLSAPMISAYDMNWVVGLSSVLFRPISMTFLIRAMGRVF